MHIIHSLLWGVATPGKLGSSFARLLCFSFSICSCPFCFLLTEFHYTFFMSYNILPYVLCLSILAPQSVVDGL